MRTVMIGLALAFVTCSADAQTPAPPAGAEAMKTVSTSADVAALMAKAKSERKDQPLISQRLLQLAPYAANLEYRASVGPAAIHETEAEMFYVIDGSATMVTGGKLVGEKRTNAANLSGTAIEGGTSRHVTKGDFLIVPEGTAHWFSAIDGASISLMTLHLPRTASGTK